MTFSFVIFVFVFVVVVVVVFFKMCTVGLYVSLCLMIFLCPFLHCKALRKAMYKRYINSIIITFVANLRLCRWSSQVFDLLNQPYSRTLIDQEKEPITWILSICAVPLSQPIPVKEAFPRNQCVFEDVRIFM